MRLKDELRLEQARFKNVKIELSNEDPHVTLGIRANLTTEVAEAFGCRELIYVNNTPRSGVEKMDLGGSEIDCDVRIENGDWTFQAVVDKIDGYVAKFEGDGPKLLFKVHLTGYAGILTDVAERVKIDPVLITLKPAQLPLEMHPEKEQEDGEAPVCAGCEAELPLADDSLVHVNGEPCTARQQATSPAADEPSESEAVLAPAAVMGGTHQRGTRGTRGRRRASTPEPAADTKDDFMAEVTDAEPVVN